MSDPAPHVLAVVREMRLSYERVQAPGSLTDVVVAIAGVLELHHELTAVEKVDFASSFLRGLADAMSTEKGLLQ